MIGICRSKGDAYAVAKADWEEGRVGENTLL
jgi:hypothetical protein